MSTETTAESQADMAARESAHARNIVLITLVLAVVAIAMVVTMGLPGLTFFGIIATVLCFVLLIIFAVGG